MGRIVTSRMFALTVVGLFLVEFIPFGAMGAKGDQVTRGIIVTPEFIFIPDQDIGSFSGTPYSNDYWSFTWHDDDFLYIDDIEYRPNTQVGKVEFFETILVKWVEITIEPYEEEYVWLPDVAQEDAEQGTFSMMGSDTSGVAVSKEYHFSVHGNDIDLLIFMCFSDPDSDDEGDVLIIHWLYDESTGTLAPGIYEVPRLYDININAGGHDDYGYISNNGSSWNLQEFEHYWNDEALTERTGTNWYTKWDDDDVGTTTQKMFRRNHVFDHEYDTEIYFLRLDESLESWPEDERLAENDNNQDISNQNDLDALQSSQIITQNEEGLAGYDGIDFWPAT